MTAANRDRIERSAHAHPAPTHPVWKASLLMVGVVILLMVLSLVSVLGR